MITSTTPLTALKGIGPKTGQKLATAGLRTVADFQEFYPRRYDDYAEASTIDQLKPGLVVVKAKLEAVSERRVRRGLHITEAVAVDKTSKGKVVWFNQPYRAASIKSNQLYYLRGEFGLQQNRMQLTNPNIEAAHEITQQATIVATYREKAGLKQPLLRAIAAQLRDYFCQLPESLPSWVVEKNKLISYGQAVANMHCPTDRQVLDAAKKRLGFEELLVVMLAAQANKDKTLSLRAEPIPFYPKLAQDFVAALPFALTDSQRKVVWQIYKDMEQGEPMNRLVEGDVGSGKTVVAAMASLMVAHAGKQVVLLAPTELLARQHATTFATVFAHSPLQHRIALLSGSVSKKAKAELKKRIGSGDVSIVIGTHAVLQESVTWHSLGLVIVDEQHRFGVAQRQQLHTKAKTTPHVLCLTATPIPRSLALTVYGELSISILDQAPSTRAGVSTSIVSPNSTAQMYQAIETELRAGRQAYVVCPLIDESEALQMASAESTYEQLKKREFKRWRVGLLHGRMKPAEKEAAMQAFLQQKLDILVATTVIEVGVDVPNATVMVVLGADRFGLAQLHQLRGRVGRGEHQGHCYLVMSDSKAPSKRMRAIAATTNGFELAELDLELRGPGAIYGTRQAGELDLRLVQLSDTALILQARDTVVALKAKGETLLHYSQIAARIQRAESLTYLN